MNNITQSKVTFTRKLWEDLRKNPMYSELIEDIEDRMELERLTQENDPENDFIDFEEYDKIRSEKNNSH